MAESTFKNLLGSLLGLIWKGVPLPYTEMRLSFRQDLAEHKFSNLDGADVEPTGRAPIQFRARIPLLNNIGRAEIETWSPGNLYPAGYLDFFKVAADRTKGTLQHPEHGGVTCVLSEFDVDWKASTRDGVYVDAIWVETLDDAGLLAPGIAGAGQISVLTQAGIDLDALLPKLPPGAFPSLPKFNPSFADFARSLQAIGDQVSLLSAQAAGKVDEIAFRVTNVLDSLSNAANPQDSVAAWPTRDACDRYLSALHGIRDSLLATGQAIRIYRPKRPASMAAIAHDIPAPVADLMTLNPQLVSNYLVPALARVRYYGQGDDTLLSAFGRNVL